MKFITNTKPLVDAIDFGIIDSNISNFNSRSCVVQLSADSHTLRINIESSMICTELVLQGSGEGAPATTFVSSSLFKKFVHTLDKATVALELTDDGLIIGEGKNSFKLPKEIDSNDFELRSPAVPEYSPSDMMDINQSDWRFIKDFQLYALATGYIHPVYTRVWVGEAGDVLVGNIDTGRFTYSKHSKLQNTCLLSDTIINLLNSLPEDAKLSKLDKDYLIQFSKDSYTYVTQFTPIYESDEGVGDYNAPVFLELMQRPSSSIQVPVAEVSKLINQAILLSTNSEDTIKLCIHNKVVALKNKDIDSEVIGDGDESIDFELDFKLYALKEVISNYTDERISLSGLADADDPTAVAGILVWNDELVTMIAGVD